MHEQVQYLRMRTNQRLHDSIIHVYMYVPTIHCALHYTEFSLCLLKGVGEGCVLGGVTNHIKAFKPHLLKDQSEFLAENTQI